MDINTPKYLKLAGEHLFKKYSHFNRFTFSVDNGRKRLVAYRLGWKLTYS